MKIYIKTITAIFLFSACSSPGIDPKIKFDKPQIQIPREQPAIKKNKGSLYSVQGASLFADKKDLQVGDIIQILISEDLQAKTDNKRELTNTRNNTLGGVNLSATSNTGLSAFANNATNAINSNLGVSLATNSSNSDKGNVTSQLAETFKTTISAIIEETYQNGNYFIKGEKEVLVEGQKQKIIISGVIRPYDITSDNSISSSQVANLKLLYSKEGVEHDIIETPWGLKLIRKIWPF